VKRRRKRRLVQKFFADRGTHLAAMIAYFALLSFVPLLFLSLALLGLAGQADEGSFFVRELNRIFPSTSLSSILRAVRSIQDNATTLGIVGGAALLWSSLSLFSVLESAFNIVYDRPNRSFLHGKALASLMLIGALTTLFVALVIGSVGGEAMKRYAPGFTSSSYVAYGISIAVSLLGVFAFLVSAYYVLTNERMRVRDVLPGAVVSAVLLEASFQVLPLYVRALKELPALQAAGGPVVLLVWMYVMANLIVFGAEVNWWWAHRDEERLETEPAGLA
jgi:membrane protein